MEGYTDLPSASSEFYTAARRFPSRNFFVIRSAPPLSFSSPAWRADQSALFLKIFPRVCVCAGVCHTLTHQEYFGTRLGRCSYDSSQIAW